MTHIRINKLTITGSDNALSPGQRQAINWTNAGILLIGHLRPNSMKSSSKFIHFHSRKSIWTHCQLPFCLGLNVLLEWKHSTALHEPNMSIRVHEITINLTVCSKSFTEQHQGNIKVTYYWHLVRGIHWSPVDSPHTVPVIWKVFLYDNFVLDFLYWQLWKLS